MPKPVKNIPKTESSVPVLCTTNSGDQYLITECPERSRFTLWHIIENGYLKLKTSSNPLEFDDIIPYNDKKTKKK